MVECNMSKGGSQMLHPPDKKERVRQQLLRDAMPQLSWRWSWRSHRVVKTKLKTNLWICGHWHQPLPVAINFQGWVRLGQLLVLAPVSSAHPQSTQLETRTFAELLHSHQRMCFSLTQPFSQMLHPPDKKERVRQQLLRDAMPQLSWQWLSAKNLKLNSTNKRLMAPTLAPNHATVSFEHIWNKGKEVPKDPSTKKSKKIEPLMTSLVARFTKISSSGLVFQFSPLLA